MKTINLMKKLVLFSFILLSIVTFSQAPEGINYQAVIRNSSGTLVANTTVAIRVQVRQASATGTVVYQERHSVLTSAQGLINLVIGSGTPQVGTFNGINWGVGPYFINLGIDLANGVTYQDYGTQQLMSVPYALYAKNSGNQLNQWRYGNTAPPTTLGTVGDFYLDVITGNVHYKNSSTTWVLTGNIKGPVGPSGATGAQGPQGVQGATGATGSTGPQGPQGIAGTNGTNGQRSLVKTTTEAPGSNCTTGGVKIEFGLDANNNGTLDAGEINATLTKYVCNGAVGATGPQGAQGPIGLTGTTGLTGPAGPTGLTGPAGPAGAQGIAGTNGVNGTNGTNGQNTLVKTTTEAAGANCTTGGVKIEYGLDANNDGTLDVSEINATLTKYVCNGAVGATGLQGPAGVAGATGPTGPTGLTGPQGPAGPAGATGLTGPQGPAGPAGSQGIAGTNGTNGINGQNTLAKTTTEAVGANCATGGVKIEYGLDANNNGTLDVSEINATLTKYVCNGAVGATGATGLTGPQGPAGANGAQGPQGIQGPVGATGATGPSGLLSSGAAAGNTPYWNGTSWITNNSNVFNNGANVGIGTTTPTVKLQVNGAATNTLAFNAGTSATIDFSQSNLAYTSAAAASYTLSNIKNGGAYSLVLTSTTNTGNATFSSTGFTFKYMGTTARTSGKTHIYSFLVVGTVVYVSMATEN
jgi:hypothetical protein